MLQGPEGPPGPQGPKGAQVRVATSLSSGFVLYWIVTIMGPGLNPTFLWGFPDFLSTLFTHLWIHEKRG